MAKITTYYQLNGMKQHKFIISQFHRSDRVQHQSHWAKLKVSVELHSFLESLEENVSLSFQVSRSAPPQSSKPAAGRVLLRLPSLLPPTSLIKTLVITLDPARSR